jgi:hypothetical protein
MSNARPGLLGALIIAITAVISGTHSCLATPDSINVGLNVTKFVVVVGAILLFLGLADKHQR